MSRTVVYRCDSCGEDAGSRKALRTIYVEWGQRTYGSPHYGQRPGIKAEFCSVCLVKLAEALGPLYGVAGKETVLAIYSKPKQKAKK